MGKYGNILVAVDGSLSAENAMAQALEIVGCSEPCNVRVVSVIHQPEDEIELIGAGIEEPVEKALKGASKIAENAGVKVDTGVLRGFACDSIVKEAEAIGSDLIVMGRRGLRRLERVLIGGVTERVIGSAGRDTLVVPRDTSLSFDNVCVATDGSDFGNEALARGIDLCSAYGGRLHVITVVDVGFEFMSLAPDALEKMEKRARGIQDDARAKAAEASVKVDAEIHEGDTYEVIVDYAKGVNAGVIRAHREGIVTSNPGVRVAIDPLISAGKLSG